MSLPRARFASLAPAEDGERRAHYLRPIVDQDERVARAYSRRSTATDVNPETGEETPPAES